MNWDTPKVLDVILEVVVNEILGISAERVGFKQPFLCKLISKQRTILVRSRRDFHDSVEKIVIGDKVLFICVTNQ